MLDPVAVTGLLVAAIRAEETARTDRLFADPFAADLAGPAGRAALADYRAAAPPPSVPVIEVRTRWYDEALARAAAAGLRQFVVLAAGMDARAYRLDWPTGARVFEVDRPAVLAAKHTVLAGVTARCTRKEVAADLADDWVTPLLAAGLDRAVPTAWMVEGLLQYLDASVVAPLFARIDALAPAGSWLLYDVVGRSMLEAPFLAGTLRMMRELGAPWIFGTDRPDELVAAHGWDTVVSEPAVVGNQWGRWPFPAAPRHVPGVPRGYLVEAIKR